MPFNAYMFAPGQDNALWEKKQGKEGERKQYNSALQKHSSVSIT